MYFHRKENALIDPRALVVTDLDAGNDPILEHARKLFDGTDQPTVTFEVRYVEGDQDRGGALSDPDLITVDRDGVISA